MPQLRGRHRLQTARVAQKIPVLGQRDDPVAPPPPEPPAFGDDGLWEPGGPVVKDLTEATTRVTALNDVRHTALVAGGYAEDADELLYLLRMLGILPSPVWWVSTSDRKKKRMEE